MFEFVRQQMRLVNVNLRRELAGKDPSQGRTASDLSLVVEGGNDILDKLDPHLRGSFYMADIDKQGVLLPHALTKRIHPLLKADALKFDYKGAGYTVTVDHAGNDETAIVLEDCAINEFVLDLMEGGSVAIKFRVQFHPNPGQIDVLGDKLQQVVIATLTAPKVQPKAQAQQQELMQAA